MSNYVDHKDQASAHAKRAHAAKDSARWRDAKASRAASKFVTIEADVRACRNCDRDDPIVVPTRPRSRATRLGKLVDDRDAVVDTMGAKCAQDAKHRRLASYRAACKAEWKAFYALDKAFGTNLPDADAVIAKYLHMAE